MHRLLFVLSVVTLLLFCGCKHKQSIKEKQQEIKIGHLSDENVYNSEDIGWTVTLPDGWDVMTGNENDKINDKGKAVIEKSTGMQVDMSGTRQLFNLRKDKSNSFLTTLEVVAESERYAYEQSLKSVYDLIRSTYESQNIKAEYSEEKEDIDELPFFVFSIKLYSPDKSKIIAYQRLYHRQIGDYDFGMVLTYNNEEDHATLLNMVRSSKFSIRD